MAEAKDLLAQYVQEGNETFFTADTLSLSVDRTHQVAKQLKKFRSDPGDLAARPGDHPADFRQALAAKEDRTFERLQKQFGSDIPRVEPGNPTARRMTDGVYIVHDWISALPHPGGLGMIIGAILLFFVILVPVTGAGESRALLLFDVLLGKKEIDLSSLSPEGRAPNPAEAPPKERPLPDNSNPGSPVTDPLTGTGGIGNNQPIQDMHLWGFGYGE